MDQQNALHILRRIVTGCDNIVFFGGAGVSTESNIPDFRSESGLYRKTDKTFQRPEEILHGRFFKEQPALFYQYYFSHMVYPSAEPNAAHKALAALERDGRLAAVVTQNVDGLHQLAGSKRVIELHGSIHRNYCTECNAFYTLGDVLVTQPKVPYCKFCGAIIKPDVVLYGEALPEQSVNNAVSCIKNADVLIVGGTSLSVYPAAGLLQYYTGDALVLINREQTPYDNTANLVIRGSIGDVLQKCLSMDELDS